MVDDKIIRNYAVALYENVKHDDAALALAQVTAIASLMKGSDKIKTIFCSPIISLGTKKRVLDLLAKKLELSRIVARFLKVLLINARFVLIPEVVKCFEKMYKESQGIKVAEVLSCKKLIAVDLQQIQDFLQAEIGKKIELDNKIDEELMGGVIIKYDSTLIDCSVKGCVEKIERVAKRSGL